MRALLRKDLYDMRWLLLALSLVMAMALYLTLKYSAQGGSAMVAYQQMVSILAPLMALLLANRLVTREYMGRTQLFLETLPVSRVQVVGTKWLLGAALLLLPMAVCLAVSLWAARGQVLLTPHYVMLVVVRSVSFMLMFYALAIAIGLTGRYRYLIWGVLVMALLVAQTQWQLAPAQWAPLHLVQESMVYERLKLPLQAVLITCGAALALVAAAFALTLASQGSLVVALSRRMTSREKAGATIVVVGLMAGVSIIDVRKERPAFELSEASYSEHGPQVAVGGGADEAESQDFANLLSADLEQLQTYLGLPQAPSLSVLPDDALDADAFQRAALPNADGVVVRAAFGSPQFDRDGFRAYALASWLQWHTHDRAAKEERRWLLDGFAQWMAARALPPQQDKLALRAAFAARLLRERHGSVERAMGQWLGAREQLGTCLSDALAWRMVASLEQQLGPQRFQALARALLAHRPPDDLRAWLFEPTLGQLLAKVQAPDAAALARQFDGLMRAEQIRLASRLDQITLPAVTFKALPMEGSIYEVHYLVGAAGAEQAPFSVHYVELGPWSAALPAEALARVDAARSGVLPASFARGTRLFTALERREALLGCSVRLAAQRWEVQ